MKYLRRIKTGSDARQALLVGVKLAYDAVASTIGPKGRDVILDNPGDLPPTVTNDGVTIVKELKVKDEFENLGIKILKMAAIRANDKAGDGPQPLYSKILTPNGFTTMGEIKVGDKVCGTNKSIQDVLGVYDKGKKEVYEVEFSDGRVVECCEDHLWTITRWNKKNTFPISKMKHDFLHENVNKEYRYYVPKTVVEFNEVELPLDPYFLGTLIGDGSLSGTGEIELSLGKWKEHILSKIKLPDGVVIKKRWIEDKNYFRVKFHGDGNTNKLIDILKSLNLYGVKSNTKFIPEIYLNSSEKTRRELLQGLLDTDGHINKKGLFEYSTVSEKLYNDFLYLVRSLGISTYNRKKEKIGKGSYSDTPIYIIFELNGYKNGNKIVDIRSTGRIEEMKCIMVSNDDNLYITDNFIVTHNTTASVILTKEIFEKGMKMIEAGANPVGIKEGIMMCLDKVVEMLRKESKLIEGSEAKKRLKQISTISGQNEKIGDVLSEIFDRTGVDSLLTIEDTDKPGIEYELTDGVQLEAGFFSHYFINDHRQLTCEYKDINVMVTNIPLMSEFDLQWLNGVKQEGINDLVIIAPKISNIVLAHLASIHHKGQMRILLIKAPHVNERQEGILSDISIVCGATLIDSKAGIKITDINSKMFGKTEKIISDRFKTIFIGAKGEKNIDERICSIKAELELEKAEYKQEQLKQRIACLSSGIAVVKVGAYSELEQKELRYKVEDAVHATRSAIEEGYLPGGGSSLVMISQLLNHPDYLSDDEKIGWNILIEALDKPLKKIAENAGAKSPDTIIDKVLNGKFGEGWNAKTGEFCNMEKEGIIDPTKVVCSSLSSAASSASTLLVANTAVVYEPEEETLNN